MRFSLISISVVALVATRPHANRERLTAHEVEVVGLDYSFAVPNELRAERTTFRFVNKGNVRHELNIVLLKQGATIDEFMAAVNANEPLTMVDATIGVLFARPGERSPSGLSTDLLAGRTYALRCILKDTKDAPRHQSLGMFTAIHVTGSNAPASKLPRADTIVAMDYAFRAPATLTPGLHYFAFVNAGKQRHEMNMSLLKKGVTVQQVADMRKNGGSRDSVFDGEGLGVLHALGGTTPLGLLQVDMLPGREYLLVCSFADSATAPPHFALGMVATIRVSERGAKPEREPQ